MYGAILGDIMSWWQKTENDGIFYLVDKKFKFSDHTVMTIAIADALLPIKDDEELDESLIKTNIIKSLTYWGKKYQSTDYSKHFKKWLRQDNLLPLEDIDNIAATMISVIPYMYNDKEKIIKLANLASEVLHSDPQIIDNVKIAALAIYYAKMCPRAVIKNNLNYDLGYALDEVDDLKNVVLEAIRDFFESINLEDAINRAISRGGDIRTRASIAGSIAEAFYGISGSNKSWCNSNLTEEMLEVLDKFDKIARRVFFEAVDYVEVEDSLFGNKRIEMAMKNFQTEASEKNNDRLINSIFYRMLEGAPLYVPLVLKDRNAAYSKQILDGDDYEYLTLQVKDGNFFIAAFTHITDEIDEKYSNISLVSIRDLFKEFLDGVDGAFGIILNPDFDNKHQCALTEPTIRFLFEKEFKNQMWYYNGDIDELSKDAIVTSEEEIFEDTLFENEDALAAAHFMKKSLRDESEYIIHTPLLNYRGNDKDIIYDCYWYCLELARKYNFHTIVFPEQFSKKDNVVSSEEQEILGIDLYLIVQKWFSENKDYGMKIIVVIGNDETTEKGKFFKVDFMNDEMGFDDDEYFSDDELADEIDDTNK